MLYYDLQKKEDIPDVLQILKVNFRNLAQITLTNTYETTMKQTKVLTVFHNLNSVMKIEGEEFLLDMFRTALEKEERNYHTGTVKRT